MSGSGRTGRIFWGAAIAVVVLDVITKYVAEHSLTLHLPQRAIGDVVRWTLAYNTGAAFSMTVGPWSRWVFGTFAAAALVVLWLVHRFYQRTGTDHWLKALALGLAWGGAAGNLIDRIRSDRGVVDFIDIGIGSVRYWTFNVADSGVSVGAVVLAILLFREDRQQAQLPSSGD